MEKKGCVEVEREERKKEANGRMEEKGGVKVKWRGGKGRGKEERKNGRQRVCRSGEKEREERKNKREVDVRVQ